MWASVCRLRHKIDRERSARDTRQDLAACLPSKQVWLGFSSNHRRGYIGGKLKLDGSMRWAASDPATLALLFFFYYALGA
jgi:hypothetical protein